MLTFIFRKILKNRWLSICQLVGLVMAVAVVAAIPTYTFGMLQRMLVKDLETIQKENGVYPGTFTLTNGFWGTGMKHYNVLDTAFKNNVLDKIKIPITLKTNIMALDGFALETGNGSERKIPLIKGMEGVPDNIEIVKGRLLQNGGKNSVYEIMVSEEGYNELGLRLGQEYQLKSIYSEKDVLNLKIVGIFREKPGADGFWLLKDASTAKAMIIDYNDLKDILLPSMKKPNWRSTWFLSLDYHKFTPGQADYILNMYKDSSKYFESLGHTGDYYFTGSYVIENYKKRESRMISTMWMLITPVLIMAVIYIYMISRLVIINDENEIALASSRGIMSRRIFLNYLIEGIIISALALAGGIPLGLVLVQIMGVSNGFMQFIGRAPVPVSLGLNAIVYSAAIIIMALIAMLIPAYSASRLTIVEHKRQKIMNKKPYNIKSIVLVSILLAISVYGVSRYDDYIKILSITSEEVLDINIDPIFFALSSVFSMGLTILIISIYPVVIRAVVNMGRRFWAPSIYASLIHMSRSDSGERLMMLFLIFSISTGVFSANTARTINRNMQDRVQYLNGADITLMQAWPVYARAAEQSALNLDGIMSDTGKQPDIRNVRYEEPPFDVFENLPGVEAAARVLVKDGGSVYLPSGANAEEVRIIGISPAEYGRVVWSRHGLLPHHINDYLNILTDSRDAVLLSSSFKSKYGLKEGDKIYLTWSGQEPIEIIVYGFVGYWPRCNPVPGNSGTPNFVVADIDNIFSAMAKEPYEVWLSKKQGVSDTEINRQIESTGIPLERIMYSEQEIIRQKNDPLLQGINGILTLNFILTIIISGIGSSIYWAISFKKRVLQFGLFRAMGMYLGEIASMLGFEQLLFIGISVMSGVAVGAAASKLYIPFIQIIYSKAEQVPPFIVTVSRSDYLKIYASLIIMMVIQICILIRISAKTHIDQALKLGEE